MVAQISLQLRIEVQHLSTFSQLQEGKGRCPSQWVGCEAMTVSAPLCPYFSSLQKKKVPLKNPHFSSIKLLASSLPHLVYWDLGTWAHCRRHGPQLPSVQGLGESQGPRDLGRRESCVSMDLDSCYPEQSFWNILATNHLLCPDGPKLYDSGLQKVPVEVSPAITRVMIIIEFSFS